MALCYSISLIYRPNISWYKCWIAVYYIPNVITNALYAESLWLAINNSELNQQVITNCAIQQFLKDIQKLCHASNMGSALLCGSNVVDVFLLYLIFQNEPWNIWRCKLPFRNHDTIFLTELTIKLEYSNQIQNNRTMNQLQLNSVEFDKWQPKQTWHMHTLKWQLWLYFRYYYSFGCVFLISDSGIWPK